VQKKKCYQLGHGTMAFCCLAQKRNNQPGDGVGMAMQIHNVANNFETALAWINNKYQC